MTGEARPASGRRRRWLLVLTLTALTIVTVTAGLTWLVVVYPATPGPGSGKVVEVQLPAGADLAALQLRVGQHALVRRPRLFALYARVLGAAGHVRAASAVLVRDNMSPRELLQRLAFGFGPTELRITFPEGLTRFDVAKRVARWGVCTEQEFLSATTDRALLASLGLLGDSAEGYLFPDTYRVRDNTAPEALVRRMVMHAQDKLQRVLAMHPDGVKALRDTLGFELHEIVTLASIVEEEAAKSDEQPVIAGVFLNRLRDPDFRPKRLQADPTVAYGCLRYPELPSCAAFDGRRVSRTMTSDPGNPYNTYRQAGLPPGPIANPGVDALRAVLAPESHAYLYFVARGGGRHTFSETLEQHNEAVRVLRGLR